MKQELAQELLRYHDKVQPHKWIYCEDISWELCKELDHLNQLNVIEFSVPGRFYFAFTEYGIDYLKFYAL
jgi:hypothetical protein